MIKAVKKILNGMDCCNRFKQKLFPQQYPAGVDSALVM